MTCNLASFPSTRKRSIPEGVSRWEASVDTVSIVIPAYNAEDFLARAVHSALQQTYPVLEIVIVDDGSSDNTREVAQALKRDDLRIKLITLSANGGPSIARNAGFASAEGDWIAVLDADDAFLPERLERMMRIGDGADIVADNLRYFDAKKGAMGRPGARRTEGWETVDLLSFADARRDHDDFGLFQPMFRRSFFQFHKLRYREEVRHGEDFQLMVEALARGAVFRITWWPGYLYTTRQSGWSRTAVDYETMSASLRVLSERDDLKLSADVRNTLSDRAAYAADLHVREQLKGAIRARRFLVALTLIAAHPVLWKFAIIKAKRKLARTRI
jgi:succinoglycan biosynthesis protein ExoO